MYRFVTFWGTNSSGKSTIPKMLIERSRHVEVVDPLGMVLDEGVVLVGTYTEGVKSGGCDRIKSNRLVKSFVTKLWDKCSVKILIAEGIRFQGRPYVIDFIRNVMKNAKVKRDVVIYNCVCSLDELDRRFQLRGKKLIIERSNAGRDIKNHIRYNERILKEVREIGDMMVIDANTEKQTEEERFNAFLELLNF